MTTEAKAEGRAHDLAVKIYVELVARNTEISQGAVKMGASAENLATLSLRLSEAFYKTEAEAILAKEPPKNYAPGSEDFAKWTK
jgi:hypothetical protein